MSRKQREREKELLEKQNKKKRMIKTTLITLAVVCASVGLIILLYMISRPKTIETATTDNGDIIIPMEQIKSGMSYIEYGGTPNLLAYKDNNGQIWTAFNTCENCFADGVVHYTHRGNTVICSICENSVSINELGKESWGGCRPVSVPIRYREDTEVTIIIPAAVLEYAEAMFASWRQGDFEVTLKSYSEF